MPESARGCWRCGQRQPREILRTTGTRFRVFVAVGTSGTIANMLRRLTKALFGYDVFISYPYSGGREYAEALEKRLTNLDFSCFFDSEELPYGQALKPSLERAIRRSKAFVLVGTEHALTAPYVDLELRTALALKRAIIPIDVQRIRTSAHWQDMADIPWVEEPVPNVEEPSAAVLEGIRHHFQFKRRNVIARGMVGVAAILFLCVAVVAMWQWRDAVAQTNRAVARLLTAQSVLVRTTSPDSLPVSALLAAESLKRLSTPDGEEALRRVVGQLPQPPQRVIPLHTIDAAYLSPTGAAIAARRDDGQIVVTSLADGKELVSFPAHGGDFAAFNASGELLVAEVGEANAEIWDVGARRKVAAIAVPEGGGIERSHFSQDGSALALVIRTSGVKPANFVRVVRLANGAVADFRDDKSAVAAALSEDASLLTIVSASMFQTVLRAVDLNTGKEIVRKAINGRANSVALHPDGASFAMTAPLAPIGGGVSGGEVVHLYSVTTFIPPPFHDIREDNQIVHDAAVTRVATSANGSFLATMTRRKTVYVWGASGNAIGQVRIDVDVSRMALADSGAILAASGIRGSVQVYDVATGRRVVSIDGDFDHLLGLGLDEGGGVLTVVDAKQGAKIYVVKEGSHLFERKAGLSELAFGPDERVLVPLGIDEAKFGILRLGSNDPIVELEPQPKLYAAFHADGKHLVTIVPYTICGGNCENVIKGDGAMRVWDIATGRVIARRELEPVGTHALSGNGLLIATVRESQAIDVIDTLGGFVRNRIDVGEAVTGLVFGDDEHLVVGTKTDVRVYNLKSSSVTAPMQLEEGLDVSQATSNGRFVFTSSLRKGQQRVRIWDTSAKKEVRTDYFVEIVPLRDGVRAVARGDNSPSAVLIDLRDGRVIGHYAHGDRVSAIAVSSDGRYVATGGADGYARVWDLDGREEIMRLPHEDSILDVAFSSGGRYLATLTRGSIRKIWAWRPEDTLAEAERRLSRNLTPQEWRRYLPDQPYRATFPSLKANGERSAVDSR